MNTINQQIEIINKLGLHARAAAKFVNISSSYSSSVDLEKNGQRVNGKSIMGVMMLAAGKGSLVTIYAEGDDADDCMQSLTELINNRFDEDE
ncbi:MAG TPA: HPr family phosphocarrier protein [Gammaproteobacteria bacterium]|nr:HPr family phosphocarrier protein [Gammaproteobacteria bacterium]